MRGSPLGFPYRRSSHAKVLGSALAAMENALAKPGTDPKATSSRGFRAFERVLYAVFVVALILATGATAGVMFSGMPPLFNQKAATYNFGNVVCLAALLVLLTTLIVAGFVRQLRGVRKIILLFLIALFTLEGLLLVFDRFFISAPGSPNQWAFRNVWVHGEAIWLPQPTPQSPFGFRNPIAPPGQKQDYRILFLGSSFVSGSGTSFDTNYPQVVAAALRSAMPDRNIGVLSAGVDGYGIKEDRLIYEHLLEKGYRFDLVVVNFNLGSDPTNDIPGTFRKSVAGEAQRFPDNWFLRSFYPVDTYIFRYAYYFKNVFDPRFGAIDANGPKDATCELSSNFISYANERTWFYYGAGADKRLYLDYSLGELFRIAQVAKTNGAAILVVLLPDRFGVLPATQAGAADGAIDRNWTRRFMQQRVGNKLPMLDLSSYFQDRPDLFACNDLHWNDPGNLEAASRVSDYLVRSIDGNRGVVSAAAQAAN